MRLLNVLLAKCELPAGFVSWSTYTGDNFDEDAITELREGAQVKIVVCSYSSKFHLLFPVRHVCVARVASWLRYGQSSSEKNFWHARLRCGWMAFDPFVVVNESSCHDTDKLSVLLVLLVLSIVPGAE